MLLKRSGARRFLSLSRRLVDERNCPTRCCTKRRLAPMLGGMAVAVGLSGDADPSRPRDGRGPAPPPARDGAATGCSLGCAVRGGSEAGELPCATPLVRDAPAGERVRYPHDSGASRASRREYDHDLYARAEPRRTGRAEPVRSPAGPTEMAVTATTTGTAQASCPVTLWMFSASTGQVLSRYTARPEVAEPGEIALTVPRVAR